VSEKKSQPSIRQCFLLGNGIGSEKEVCLGSYNVGYIVSRQQYNLFFFEELEYAVFLTPK